MAQSINPPIARWPLTQGVAARVGGRLTTTPGRMRLAGATIVVALLALALVGTGAVRARQRATSAVATQAEPLLVGAERLYTSLDDADATATNTFLDTFEPPARRLVYLTDLATATDQLAKVAAQAGSSQDAARALAVINTNLPTYTGLIEAARANNRLGFPVGAAYLREGSTLMQKTILPAVGALYQVEAGRLDRAYNSGRSLLDVVGVLLLGAIALAMLVLAQGFVARRTNRMVNPGLLAAALLMLMVLAWTTLAFVVSGSRLAQARAKGSDPVQLLSSARILVARDQVDENLALVARGSGSQYLADFDAVSAALQAPGATAGLLDEAESAAPSVAVSLTDPSGPYAAYQAAHAAVVKAEKGGQFAMAVTLATGTAAGDELTAATQLSATLNDQIQAAQNVFAAKAAAASHDLTYLTLAVLGLVVLGAAAALLGLEPRIREYR